MPADTSQVRALAARLRGTGAVFGDDMRQVVTVAARAIAADARRRAPVGGRYPGTLRNSIRVRVFFGLSAVVEAPARNTSGIPYAAFVEYGAAGHAPQPFLHPAADAGEDKFYASAERAAYEALTRL